MDSAELRGRERARRPKRVDTCAPERLVGVDVPESGDSALVEQGRLDGSRAAGEPTAVLERGEARTERLLAESLGEVLVELARLEQQSGAEPPHVAIADVRSVV